MSLLSHKRIGGNNKNMACIRSLGIPILSRSSIIGFKCVSNGNERICGNDSTKHRKEASEEPSMSKPPRRASIYTIKPEAQLTKQKVLNIKITEVYEILKDTKS